MTEREWIPMRTRWFVERRDFGRTVVIQPCEEDSRGMLRRCHIKSFEPEQPEHWVLTGNESVTAHFRAQEAQELMDAMWQAGLRPTRR